MLHKEGRGFYEHGDDMYISHVGYKEKGRTDVSSVSGMGVISIRGEVL
jgi:hypothetical protein